METSNLIRMANSIGDFFEAQPDREAALEGIATHIRKFWEPRMRRQFLELMDGGGAGASDIIVSTVQKHRQRLA